MFFFAPLWFLKLKFDSIAKSDFYATLKGLKTFLIQSSKFLLTSHLQMLHIYAIYFLLKMIVNKDRNDPS